MYVVRHTSYEFCMLQLYIGMHACMIIELLYDEGMMFIADSVVEDQTIDSHY